MIMGYMSIGTKDAVLAIAIVIILGLTIIFKWSATEALLSAVAVILAFFGGNMKRDKRLK